MANHRFSVVSGSEEEEACCSKKAKICLGVFLGLLVLVTVAVVVGILMGRRSPKWNGKGSTVDFQEIILRRCHTYIRVVQPELGDRDCQKIKKAFTDAFISKDPCSAREEDYDLLMKLGHQTVPCDKTVFWSKTKELAHQYTKTQKGLFTLENTLLGYIADDLSWCGKVGSSEINLESCPDRRNCNSNFVSVFRNLLSKRFAENACGMVQVFLNGSISNAFDKTSTFGRVEVHSLQPSKVHTLKAWVIHDSGKTPRDTCSGSSINELQLILRGKNIKFTCQENYRPI
ncbi:ADP-ribosyl cyclase/cyclic ADP-ribose hydrolase 1 [Sus scrofa]|uniref:ADP-ribosyl cyclase/cyclic ADP-ribose hydrolase 1 n=1 Tax=Sus scrofa TaxID=9823 RepID=UPI000223C358|nr:ADP-ribosyl cyclase/cyclic ADP-ribose hydrolase 1 [Sus scrofa]